ncbi:MAG: HEAT repeat domain-containing protein [bacterium]
MSKKIIFTIFALFCSTFCNNGILASNDTTSSGLTMQISSDKKKYQPFQPINISITITNNTPNEITFNKRFAITKRKEAGFKSEIEFKVVKPDGGEAEIEFISDVASLAESDFVKIKPKTKYEKILEINRWYWKELAETGLYTLKCNYFNDMPGYQKLGSEGYELVELSAWIGGLDSNTITFVMENITKEGVNALTARLTDETIYWGERSKVAEILGDLKNGWALAPLLSRLTTGENEVVRNKCIEAIVKYGTFPTKRLIRLLASSDPITRILSAKTLCLLGEKKGIRVVRKELQNKDWQVVREAMLALQCLDKDIAIKDITKYDLVNDEEEIISFTAAKILRELGVE